MGRRFGFVYGVRYVANVFVLGLCDDGDGERSEWDREEEHPTKHIPVHKTRTDGYVYQKYYFLASPHGMCVLDKEGMHQQIAPAQLDSIRNRRMRSNQHERKDQYDSFSKTVPLCVLLNYPTD